MYICTFAQRDIKQLGWYIATTTISNTPPTPLPLPKVLGPTPYHLHSMMRPPSATEINAELATGNL